MKKTKRHPALDAMNAAAHGYLKHFTRDLTVHDVATLARVPHGCAFAWIVNPSGTHLALCDGAVPELAHPYVRMIEGKPTASARGFAVMIDRTFSGCRFYFWTGAQLEPCVTAAELDSRTEQWEDDQRALAARRCRQCGALCDHASWNGVDCPWCRGSAHADRSAL